MKDALALGGDEGRMNAARENLWDNPEDRRRGKARDTG